MLKNNNIQLVNLAAFIAPDEITVDNASINGCNQYFNLLLYCDENQNDNYESNQK